LRCFGSFTASALAFTRAPSGASQRAEAGELEWAALLPGGSREEQVLTVTMTSPSALH